MKAHKIEVVVLDFEDYGVDEYINIISNHRHLSASCLENKTVDIGEWSDDHPLNNRKTHEAESTRLFEGEHYAVFTQSGEGDFEQLSNWLIHDAAVKFRDNWIKSALLASTSNASIFKRVTND